MFSAGILAISCHAGAASAFGCREREPSDVVRNEPCVKQELECRDWTKEEGDAWHYSTRSGLSQSCETLRNVLGSHG